MDVHWSLYVNTHDNFSIERWFWVFYSDYYLALWQSRSSVKHLILIDQNLKYKFFGSHTTSKLISGKDLAFWFWGRNISS